MRASWLVVLALISTGCGSSTGTGAPIPLREYHAVGDNAITLDMGQDAALTPQIDQALAGREFFLGLFHRFDTSAEQLTLRDGQVVGSQLPGVEDQAGPWDYADGWLTLDGATASYGEPLSRIPPVLTQLVLRGSFDRSALETQVAALAALPFDPARPPAAATSPGTVSVHWELAGLLNGAPLDVRCMQTLHVVAVDANTR